MRGVSEKRQLNRPDTVGFGNILIPTGVDRDKFVATCIRKKRVSVLDDRGAVVYHQCYITNEAIQNVFFPENVGELGSKVIFTTNMYRQKPFVIGTLDADDYSEDNGEGEKFFSSYDKDGGFFVGGSPKKGTLFFRIFSKTISKIFIKSSGNEKAEVNVESEGNVNVAANKVINLNAFENLQINVKDVNSDDVATIDVKSGTVTITAKQTVITNATPQSAIPNLSGNLNCITNCPFNGLSHGVNKNIKKG